MNDIFITQIEIKKVRNIENFTISLSETERKHLIITGKNGSGKTSLLLLINQLISYKVFEWFNKGIPPVIANISFWKRVFKNENEIVETNKVEDERQNIIAKEITKLGDIFVKIANENNLNKNYIFVLFEAKRTVLAGIPKGINKIEINKDFNSIEKININFIQHIVNLKAERSFAKDDNDFKAVAEIDAWFERFESQLKKLFEAPDLKLVFDRKNYNFYIQISNNEPFSLNQLSDGYSAALSIVTELILRMEANGMKDIYNIQGVVLIDEIETHLHLALQKKIMPFLCAFFPKIQFIVTTHSPFVISSLENAVVCDLERREVINEDLTGYSYHALVESYFDTDEYSQEIKEKLYRYKFLSEQEILSDDEEDEYDDLEYYFDNLPKFRAAALAAEAERIGLKKMMRKG